VVVLQPIPVQAGRDGLQLQAGLAWEQLVSSVPPLAPRHVQVSDAPHHPETTPVRVPVVQL
jgi:hypothetical protein